MIDSRKYFVRLFYEHLGKTYGDISKFTREQFEEKFNMWFEENHEELIKQFEEYCQQFIYKGEK
jgi:hypothetical protein